MKKLIFWSNLLILLFVPVVVFCQNDKTSKLEIIIGGGVSLPVGSYRQSDPLKSAILDENAPFTRIIGFAKSKNGFAMPGNNFNLELKYKLFPSLRLILLASRFVNPVKSSGMTDYLVQVYSLDQKMQESDYKILSLATGVGYEYRLSKFDFNINLLLGYAIAKYPYYKFILLYTETSTNPPLIFAHDGTEPTLKSFTYGTSLSANYNISSRFRVGVEAFYQKANFAYHMSNRVIPGGSTVYEISDALNVNVINIALRVAYSFFYK